MKCSKCKRDIEKGKEKYRNAKVFCAFCFDRPKIKDSWLDKFLVAESGI